MTQKRLIAPRQLEIKKTASTKYQPINKTFRTWSSLKGGLISMHSMAALGPYQKSTFAKSNFAHRCHRSTWSHNVRSMFVSHVITYICSTLDICWSKTVAKTVGCCPFYVSGYVVVVVLADSLSLPLSILFLFGSCFVTQYFVHFLVL